MNQPGDNNNDASNGNNNNNNNNDDDDRYRWRYTDNWTDSEWNAYNQRIQHFQGNQASYQQRFADDYEKIMMDIIVSRVNSGILLRHPEHGIIITDISRQNQVILATLANKMTEHGAKLDEHGAKLDEHGAKLDALIKTSKLSDAKLEALIALVNKMSAPSKNNNNNNNNNNNQVSRTDGIITPGTLLVAAVGGLLFVVFVVPHLVAAAAAVILAVTKKN